MARSLNIRIKAVSFAVLATLLLVRCDRPPNEIESQIQALDARLDSIEKKSKEYNSIIQDYYNQTYVKKQNRRGRAANKRPRTI